MVTHPFRDCVIKTDYSGFFSVSLKAKKTYSPPKSMGLAVSLSETRLPQGDSRQAGAPSEVKVTRLPRGSRGLTSYGKRLVVGSVNLLEQRHGKHNLVFHTATLPTDDPALKIEALKRSKQVLKYWRKVLSRLLDRVGLPKDDIVIVLELQKRGAVHFHTVFVNHYRRGRYVLSLQQLDKAWRQALTAIMPVLKQADFSKSCRTERVRKSAGRYLAKYLSKGAFKFSANFSITWYSVGDAVKQRLKELEQTLCLSVRRDFNFSALAQVLASSKLAWCLDYFVLDGAVRSLFGYFDYRCLNFIDQLFQSVVSVNSWVG